MIYGCIHFDSRFQCAIPHITTRAQCKYHFLQSETALALCSDTSWKKRKKNFKTHPAAKKKKKSNLAQKKSNLAVHMSSQFHVY